MESVWDYPRPPALVPCERRVRIEHAGVALADSTRALRVLETSHPPTIYVPADDVRMECFAPSPGSSLCEWKGRAAYLDVVVGDRRETRAGWYYERPARRFASLAEHVSVYPGRMDACWLDDERVQAQDGDFYGGWITADVTGPFKGGRGTLGW